MERRLHIDDYLNIKTATSRFNLPIVSILNDPVNEWKKICYGGNRVAHSLAVDWKKYNFNDFLFTHNSIVSSVATEPNGYYIKPVCSPIVNANGNAWTNEVLLATFKSFIGGESYLEHVQVPSLSKGKILDAVLRPFTYRDQFGNTADVFICDILVATARIHWDLVQKIQSGILNTLSMGEVCKYVQCSKCGQIFSDDEDSCDHIKHELLTTFTDENGIKRIVSELCGRSFWDKRQNCWVGDPESMKFIEASWVENPAFKGAVVNHFVEANTLDPQYEEKLAAVNELNFMAEDYGKLRVADRYGMLAIRLAQEEYFRHRRNKTIDKVINWK